LYTSSETAIVRVPMGLHTYRHVYNAALPG